MSASSPNLAAAEEVVGVLERLVVEGHRAEALRELRRLRGILTDVGEELAGAEEIHW